MKDKMLKLAGVKTEAQFYKLFPSEEAFMKVHGKAFQKALRGAKIEKAQWGAINQSAINSTNQGIGIANDQGFNVPNNELDLSYLKFKAPTTAPFQEDQSDIDATTKAVTAHANLSDTTGPIDATQGSQKLPAGLMSNNSVNQLSKLSGIAGKAAPYIGAAVDVAQGLGELKGQHQAVHQADLDSRVMGLNAKAMESGMLAEQPKRQYVRPEDQVNTGEELFPTHGTGEKGTNPLARNGYMLQGGGEIQNTYAPNTLYDDLGFEPLNNSDKVKAYYYGGKIPQAGEGVSALLNDSPFGQVMGSGGGNALQNISNWGSNKINHGYDEAGTKIGKGVGTAAGTIIGGPIGGMIGGAIGGVAGSLIDRSGEKRARFQGINDRYAQQMTGMAMGQGLRKQNSEAMEDGGNIPQAQIGKKLSNIYTNTGYQSIANTPEEHERQNQQIDQYGASFVPQNKIDNFMNVWDKNKMIVKDTYNKFNSYNPDKLNKLPLEDIWKIRKENRELNSSMYNATTDEENLSRTQIMTDQIRGMRDKYLPEENKMYGYYDAQKDSLNTSYNNFDKISKDAMLIKEKETGMTNEQLDQRYKTFFKIKKDGGNINPQLINYFGDHTAQDVYDFAHEGMDSLRTGGNIRQNLFTQQSMAMGGELQTHWGGYAEPIADNPYLPSKIINFKGNSHKEIDDQGNTGIGITYGDNPVEVEGGEPAVKLQNGGQEDSLVVFGNLKFDKKLAMATNDKELIELADEYGGKKFKRIEHHIANKTNRENKKIAKATSELNELDSTTSFDKLKLTSLKATIDGGNMKLKKYAADTQNLANYQEALNATADENGFIADNLARGEVKIDKNAFSNSAEFGTSIPKAQHGWDSEKETAYSNWLNEITSRTGSNKNNIDTPQNKKIFEEKWKSETSHRKDVQLEKNRNVHRDIYNKYLKDKRIGEMNLSYEDFVKNILHYGIEGAQTPEFKQWYSKTTGKPISPSPVQTTGKSTTKLAGDNATKREAAIRSSGQPPVAQPSGYVSKYGLVPWKGNTSPGDRYGMKTKSSFTGEEWDKIAENLGFTGQGNEEFQNFLLNNPQSKPLIEARHKELYGKTPFIDKKLGYGWAAKELLNLIPPSKETPKLPGMSVTTDKTTTRIPYTPPIEDKPKFPWIPALNTLIPYLRPTDQEQLDPNQLAGEMYAMSNNKVEPVQYQNYQPELTVPYDISLQDIMNENQADYRSAQRMSGYNPAALASLNAQKYGANQKVLAEQFRLNQAEKDKVYSENRNILNDAQLKNLQGLDQQYVRQQEALSNTKATTLAALNSISDKYAKNKLENRQLGVYENLYNYRYNDQMKAQNYNPFAQFDINGGMGTTGLEGLTEEEKAIAIADANLNRAKKALATTKTKVRNGAIVQSANKL